MTSQPVHVGSTLIAPPRGMRARAARLRAVDLRTVRLRTARALLLPAALLSFALAGCGGRERAASDPPTVPVQTVKLADASEPAVVEATGSLQAGRETTVAGKVMGTVTELRKHAGEYVRQGEILLVVDSRDVAGQVAQAQGALTQASAAAALAEANLHRFEQLRARGSASQLEYDQARYQYDTAQGAVRAAQGAVSSASSYQSYAEIPAPFSGRVVDQLCEVGDLAAPGRPLMKLEDPSHLRLYASLDAARAAVAVEGTEVAVVVPAAGDRTFRGRIAEVVPAADPATRSVLVKIDLEPDPELRSGLYAKALLPQGEKQCLRVPRSAVVQRGGITGAFVVESGRAAFRLVVLGQDPVAAPGDKDSGPEVVSGLAAGDVVIVDPPSGLEVGSPVEARS